MNEISRAERFKLYTKLGKIRYAENLRKQGLTLKQIGQIMGHTAPYIRELLLKGDKSKFKNRKSVYATKTEYEDFVKLYNSVFKIPEDAPYSLDDPLGLWWSENLCENLPF